MLSARLWVSRLRVGSVVVAMGCGGGPSGRSPSPVAAASSSAGDSAALVAASSSLGLPFAIQIGHSGDVSDAAFSPDGLLVATGDHTGTIQLWDPKTGEVHATLEGHTANVTSLAFSKDGLFLVSGGEDGRAFVWDLQRGVKLTSVQVPDRKIRGVAFDASGDLIALRDNQGLSVRRAKTGDPLWATNSSNASATSFSPDGTLIVVGNGSTLQLVDFATGRVVTSLQHDKAPRAFVFSGQGNVLATAGGDSKKITLFDVPTWTKTREIVTSGRVVAVAIDDKATIVAGAIEGHGIQVFDARTGAALSTIAGKLSSELHFGMTSDGARVFTSNGGDEIDSFNSRTGRAASSTRCSGMRRFVVDRPRGRVALLRDRDPSVDIWDGTRGTARLEGAPERVRSATLFADGSALAIVEEDSPDVVIFDLETGGVRATLKTGLNHVYEALPSFDGSRLFVTGYGESAILDAKTGRELRRFAATNWSSQHEAAWSVVGQLAFVGLDDHTLQIFSPTLAPLPSIDIGSPAPTSIAYSPDGQTLAMAGRAGVALIRQGTPQKLVEPFNDPTYGLAWSPDGTRLAFASERMFSIVEVGSGKRIDLGSGKAFVSAAFSPDGTREAAAQRDGSIELFTGNDLERTIHARTTPWSLSYLPKSKAPVVIVPAGDLRLIRVTDGASVRLRSFDVSGHRVGFAVTAGAVAGDPSALERVKLRKGADVRAALIPLDPRVIRPGLALELGH